MRPFITKLKDKISNYFHSKSKFSIASDTLFLALLIALIIPASRTEVIVTVRKLIMFQPSVKENSVSLDDMDYDWNYQTLDGDVISFNELENKVVFLNVWATWCPHCVAEMPGIQRLYEKFGDRVAFVIISNENPGSIKAYMKKKGYSFPVYLTYNQLPEKLESRSIPATYIISRDGEIKVDKKGAAKWDGEKVTSLLEALIQ